MWRETEEAKGEIDKSAVTADDFPRPTDWRAREKISKDIDLNDTINLTCKKTNKNKKNVWQNTLSDNRIPFKHPQNIQQNGAYLGP